MMTLRILFLFVLFTIKLNGEAQSSWKLAKNSNGIKVYTRTTDTSEFKSIKVEGVFEGTLDRLINLITDINGQKQWVYSTKNAYPLKKISDNELLYYVETAVPWPADNRDAVLQMRVVRDANKNVNKVLIVGKPNAIPLKKGIVRVPYFNALWEIKPLDKQRLFITYYLDMNPGGNLPAAIVNMFTSKGPYETFVKLSQLLKQ